jgi:hypothetical protein
MSFPLLPATTGKSWRTVEHVRLLSFGFSANAADVVSMVSSVISGLQMEDPSQSGLFNKVPTSRNQNYKLMNSQHT